MTTKIYLPVFLAIYFIIVLVIPTVRVKRRTGINPYVFKNTDSAHDYLGKISAPISLMVLIVTLTNLIYPDGLEYMAPFIWLELSLLRTIGFLAIHLALVWIIVAQIQMSDSWRVGIDKAAKTELKTNGLFSVSRNPVFLGMLVTLVGVFLIIPNALTLLAFVVLTLLFEVQVRLEEEYLTKTHGDNYTKYCKKTRRWL